MKLPMTLVYEAHGSLRWKHLFETRIYSKERQLKRLREFCFLLNSLLKMMEKKTSKM